MSNGQKGEMSVTIRANNAVNPALKTKNTIEKIIRAIAERRKGVSKNRANKAL